MQWLRQKGISFALIGERFRSLDAMEEPIRNALAAESRRPLVIVFPEAALRAQVIARPDVKPWLLRTHEMLRKHGNAFVFLSLLERTGSKRDQLVNTGYLITPHAKARETAHQGGRLPWMAYAKRSYAAPEAFISEIAGLKADRVPRRSHKGTEGGVYRFPRVLINGKDVELRVCLDATSASKTRPKIMVVPSAGPGEEVLSVSRYHVRKRGIALFNDVQFHEPRRQRVHLRRAR
jgi:hypothetical protein